MKWLQTVFSGKRSLKMLSLSDLGQRSMNYLDLGLYKSSCTHLFDYMYQLSPHRPE